MKREPLTPDDRSRLTARWKDINAGTGQAECVSFLTGIVLFSGSLYVLSITGMKQLGLITPLRGLTFLIGRAVLA